MNRPPKKKWQTDVQCPHCKKKTIIVEVGEVEDTTPAELRMIGGTPRVTHYEIKRFYCPNRDCQSLFRTLPGKKSKAIVRMIEKKIGSD